MLVIHSASSYATGPAKPSVPTCHDTTSLVTSPFQGSISQIWTSQVNDTHHYQRSPASQSFINLHGPILTGVIQLSMCYRSEVKPQTQAEVQSFAFLNSTSFFTFIMIGFFFSKEKVKVKPLSYENGLENTVQLHNDTSTLLKCFHCMQGQW